MIYYQFENRLGWIPTYFFFFINFKVKLFSFREALKGYIFLLWFLEIIAIYLRSLKKKQACKKQMERKKNYRDKSKIKNLQISRSSKIPKWLSSIINVPKDWMTYIHLLTLFDWIYSMLVNIFFQFC